MKLIGEVMKELYTPGKTSDSKYLRTEICEGCKEEVEVKEEVYLFGPEKGKTFEWKYGCVCRELEYIAQIKKEAEENRIKRLQSVFDKNSLINSNLQKAAFDSYQPTNQALSYVKERVMEYTNSFDVESPKNLLMTGMYGLGKSHLSISATKVLMEKGHTCIFISVPKLLSKIKATYNKKSEHTEDELLRWLESVTCLVLDDIGAEQRRSNDDGESWAVSKLFEIIDSRVGKHTIYTTNLNSAELQKAVGPRNFSRMMQDTEILKLEGQDYRLKDF